VGVWHVNTVIAQDTVSVMRKDDMREVYDLLKEAEMLVIASPICYHGISGQL